MKKALFFGLCATLSLIGLTLNTAVADEDEGAKRVSVAFSKLVGESESEGLVVEPLDDNGLYRVALTDGRTADVGVFKDRIMIGEIYVESTMQTLGDAMLADNLGEIVKAIPEDDLIVFSSGEVKKVITVFTDLDCGFCRSLHENILDINKAGIEVRYAPYPRSGPDTESFQKMESVYCSDDRNAALTAAKAGNEIDSLKCTNPVTKHFTAASAGGVSYTPTVYTDDGRLIGGFPGTQEFINQVLRK